MKKLQLLIMLFVLASTAFAQDIQPIAVGTPLPMADVKMKSIDGREVAIKDLIGKNGVLVMFSCNTCPYVVKYQSRTLDAIKQAKQNGIGFIIINSNEGQRDNEDSYSAMQQYGKKQHYDVPYVVDNNAAAANAFGATRTPECYLFNSKNILVYHGAIDDNQDMTEAKKKHLSNAMIEMISGKSVTVNNTRSVGCSIKRPE